MKFVTRFCYEVGVCMTGMCDCHLAQSQALAGQLCISFSEQREHL